MLSLAELRRAVRILDAELRQARLQHVIQPDATSVVLELYGRGDDVTVLLSCRGEAARVSLLDRPPPAPPKPAAFAQYLRAHLQGTRCTGVRLLGEDRQAAIRLESGGGAFDLILSLLGRRSNVYLIEGEALRASLRPLAETRRDLAVGQPWKHPASPAPALGADRWAEVGDEDYLAAIESSYRGVEDERARDELLRRMDQSLRKELLYLERREAKISEDIASAQAATGARRLGELLKGVLHQVKPGDRRVVAIDHASGEEVQIPLDPTLSPAENLARLFARYQKAQKGVKALEQQRGDVLSRRDEMMRLAGELRMLGSTPDLAALEAFAARGAARALLARHYPRKRTAPRESAAKPARASRFGKAKVPARLLPKVYVSADGLEIWVGRSDEGNDYLTTRLAHGNDLFFHVEGLGGSHVILRTEGRKDPPSTSLLDASELAVHFSKAREAARAEVHVAPIKDVKKPRGAKPGLVHVLRGKTIHLRRDRGRLERLLNNRTED